MQSFGSDRVRLADDGSVLLSSRLDKGWVVRKEKTLTRAEFPGTAVLWEEVYYEVVSAEPLPAGGVRYALLPWREEHAMRVVDRYDAESEGLRLEEHRKAVARERRRKSANLLGMLTGHLPAAVQEAMGREIGVLPVRLTMLSAVLSYAIFAVLVLLMVDILKENRVPPFSMMFAALYFFGESSLRLFLTMTQNRPFGSPIGVFAYIFFYALAPNRARLVSPFHVEKGLATPIGDAPEDIALRDAFILREPFVTLLSPEEQARARERFGYDYRKHSFNMAVIILVVAIAGIASSFYRGAVAAGLAAAGLLVEQIVRLIAFRRGPAASVLGWVARPFVRKLLS